MLTLAIISGLTLAAAVLGRMVLEIVTDTDE
jgi:hypothetical protein